MAAGVFIPDRPPPLRSVLRAVPQSGAGAGRALEGLGEEALSSLRNIRQESSGA